MGENKLAKKLHAIMIAVPYQGHLNPFVNLAIKLASKGCTITFVHIEYIHQQISKSQHSTSSNYTEVDLFLEARNSGLDIRYMTISDGFPVEFDRNVNMVEYWESMIRDFPTKVDRFIGTLIESFDPIFVPILVADTVFSWPGTIANKYNLVNVSFWTEPALVFAINYHLDLLIQNGHFPPTENQDHTINYIPGVDSITTKDLMSHLREADTTTIVHQIVFNSFTQVTKADFILHNTIQELESNTLSSLNQKQPTYAVGPVNFSMKYNKTNVSKSLLSESNCTEWLESKPRKSVLYVSFGSVVQVNKQVIEEIAYGLLLSEVKFIWVVRPNADILLPIGFKNDVKDRGLIVTWCNQTMMLSNSAIGGFLTHCGWNSIVESICCGVPMICYPVTYDQPTNRKLVVDDWKIGINLCDDQEMVTREEIAMKIKEFMIGEISSSSSYGIKQEIKKVQIIMNGALNEDGSSKRNFDRFLEDLKDKIHGNV
ncbi:hypothetical protein RD792_011960 [Penstemon davidsonii]|uniref:Glycosyltransferase n=1 Tax=Penstemon davidsonii TaxID=160366 RepID=A0ABR0CVI2_9LAMI|nr:hypothetical protein RD792_011960 [Penstemon davidsonii]